jgi:DNA-binding transcriptional LysR family regulator
MNLELEDIRVFLALAEELHFGRTAERMRISPARVSQRIQAVERVIGGSLFERTSRRVVLTPLGTEFRDAVRPAYAQLDAAVAAARTSARTPAGQLRLGFTATTAGEELDDLVRAAEHELPQIDLVLREVQLDAPLEALRGGEVDALLNWFVFDAPDITQGPVLARHGMVAMVAADHPLARRDAVLFEEVAAYALNDMPRLRQNVPGFFFPQRTESGRLVHTEPVATWQEAQSQVARGRTVHVTVAAMARRISRSNMVFVPITDLPPVALGLLWHGQHESARIRALVALAESTRPDEDEVNG